MMSFSQRKGLKPVRSVIQVDSMDNDLRYSLWNVLHEHIWSMDMFMNDTKPVYGWDSNKAIYPFYESFRRDFQKLPADKLWKEHDQIYEELRKFYFSAEFNEVYDFLEFVTEYFRDAPYRCDNYLNDVLERELAGYRIVSGIVTDVTDEQEVAALEEALQDSQFEGVQAHLRRALELLSDKTNPDYRNSIKESILAVESICRVITGKDKATLGEALIELEKSGKIHKALKNGFSSLYGWTSDEGGIRHAMLEEPNISAHEAKYFLVSFTSFINYLKSKID